MAKEFLLEIDPTILAKRPFMVGTPMYGGLCTGHYNSSMMALKELCTSNGIPMFHSALYSESLITRARNYIAEGFLKSECTHLMFIDSDIHFNPFDVLAMLQLADPTSDKDVVFGVYPKKQIVWHNIKNAVDRGAADQNPLNLNEYAGSLIFSVVEPGEYNFGQPIEVAEAATGFMMIQKHVFERLIKENPQWLYYPDHKETKDFDGSRKIGAYFQDPIVDERHLSEDYFFCREARKIGMKLWACPWIKLGHIGSHEFVADIRKMSEINIPLINTQKV